MTHVFRTHRAHGHLQHSPVARCRAARPTPGFSARRSIPCKNHRPPLFAPLPSAPFAVRSRGLRHATFVRILDHCVCGRPQHRPVARCQTAGPTLGFSAFLSIACINNRAPLVASSHLHLLPYAATAYGTLFRYVSSTRPMCGCPQQRPASPCETALPTSSFSALRSMSCKNHRPPLFTPFPPAPFAVRGRGAWDDFLTHFCTTAHAGARSTALYTLLGPPGTR